MSLSYAQRVITRKRKMRGPGLDWFTRAVELIAMNEKPVPVSILTMHLGAWRNSRKLTLERLAEQIGSKVSTISGWERGRRNVDLEDLAKLAAAYGVHPAALLFAPEQAGEKVRRMQAASTLAERMPEEIAEEWLTIGRRIAGPKGVE